MSMYMNLSVYQLYLPKCECVCLSECMCVCKTKYKVRIIKYISITMFKIKSYINYLPRTKIIRYAWNPEGIQLQ